MGILEENIRFLELRGYKHFDFEYCHAAMEKSFPGINGSDFLVRIYFGINGKNQCDIWLGNVWLCGDGSSSIETNEDVPVEIILSVAGGLIQSHAQQIVERFIFGSSYRSVHASVKTE